MRVWVINGVCLWVFDLIYTLTISEFQYDRPKNLGRGHTNDHIQIFVVLTLKEPGGGRNPPPPHLDIFVISQPVVIFSRWNFMTFFLQALRSI